MPNKIFVLSVSFFLNIALFKTVLIRVYGDEPFLSIVLQICEASRDKKRSLYDSGKEDCADMLLSLRYNKFLRGLILAGGHAWIARIFAALYIIQLIRQRV